MKKVLLALVAMGFSSVAFAENPPVSATSNEFNGHCALGMTMGKMVPTDCSINWVDSSTSKKYCFSTEQAKSNWAKDTKSNIEKADSEYLKSQKQS
jgi:hypothetical protein